MKSAHFRFSHTEYSVGLPQFKDASFAATSRPARSGLSQQRAPAATNTSLAAQPDAVRRDLQRAFRPIGPRPPCPAAPSQNLRRKLALWFGARAPALTPQTVAPDRALGLRGLSHRLRARRGRATAGRPVWAKAPQRRSRERRGQLFRTCARAGTPELFARRSAAAARCQRPRVDAEPPTPARVVK